MPFVERFFDLISLVLSQDPLPSTGPELTELAQSLDRELEREARQPLGNISPQVAQLARDAIMAWIDEWLQTATPTGESAWGGLSLLHRRRGISHGGDLFFQELAWLLIQRHDYLAPPRARAPQPASLLTPGRQVGQAGRDPAWPEAELTPLWPASLAPLDLQPVGRPSLPPEAAWVGEPTWLTSPPGPNPGNQTASDPTAWPGQFDPTATGLGWLARWWALPGEGPKSLNEALEVFALALALGFRGRLAEPGQAEAAEALLEVATEWLRGRHPRTSEKTLPPGWWPDPPSLWERGWSWAWLALPPALLTLLVFWRSQRIIDSLLF
jgi:type VI protein secretion system component VasF